MLLIPNLVILILPGALSELMTQNESLKPCFKLDGLMGKRAKAIQFFSNGFSKSCKYFSHEIEIVVFYHENYKKHCPYSL